MYINVIYENIDISITFVILMSFKAYFINSRFRRTFFIVYFVFFENKNDENNKLLSAFQKYSFSFVDIFIVFDYTFDI